MIPGRDACLLLNLMQPFNVQYGGSLTLSYSCATCATGGGNVTGAVMSAATSFTHSRQYTQRMMMLVVTAHAFDAAAKVGTLTVLAPPTAWHFIPGFHIVWLNREVGMGGCVLLASIGAVLRCFFQCHLRVLPEQRTPAWCVAPYPPTLILVAGGMPAVGHCPSACRPNGALAIYHCSLAGGRYSPHQHPVRCETAIPLLRFKEPPLLPLPPPLIHCRRHLPPASCLRPAQGDTYSQGLWVRLLAPAALPPPPSPPTLPPQPPSIPTSAFSSKLSAKSQPTLCLTLAPSLQSLVSASTDGQWFTPYNCTNAVDAARQLFSFDPASGLLILGSTGSCVVLEDPVPAVGTRVMQYRCYGWPSQRWQYFPDTSSLRPILNTSLCLAVKTQSAGTALINLATELQACTVSVATPTAGLAQQWTGSQLHCLLCWLSQRAVWKALGGGYSLVRDMKLTEPAATSGAVPSERWWSTLS